MDVTHNRKTKPATTVSHSVELSVGFTPTNLCFKLAIWAARLGVWYHRFALACPNCKKYNSGKMVWENIKQK